MKVTNGETTQKGSREEAALYFSDKPATNKCPVRDVISRISDKWTLHAIICLGRAETLRFTALKNKIEGVSQRMLTVTLRTLEEDGFVTRTVYPQIPPRVEYALTPLGRSLLSQVISLSEWANEHMNQVFTARDQFNTAN